MSELLQLIHFLYTPPTPQQEQIGASESLSWRCHLLNSAFSALSLLSTCWTPKHVNWPANIKCRSSDFSLNTVLQVPVRFCFTLCRSSSPWRCGADLLLLLLWLQLYLFALIPPTRLKKKKQLLRSLLLLCSPGVSQVIQLDNDIILSARAHLFPRSAPPHPPPARCLSFLLFLKGPPSLSAQVSSVSSFLHFHFRTAMRIVFLWWRTYLKKT